MSEDWKSKYDNVDYFSEGLAKVKLNGQYGFVDQQGNVVIPLKYDMAGGFHGGLARVQLKRKYGFIDQQGNVVVPLKYDYAGNFHEGLASVSGLVSRPWPERTEGVTHITYGKSGFIDKEGKQVIPLIYDDAGGFEEGLAKVELDDKVGFIDKEGNEYWDMTADEARRQMRNR